MTGGSARHGRRDNGLFAAAYAAVGDVDPRVGEHLLDVLGNRGIAAYLQPTIDTHPFTRMTTLPSRPTDRLYVDRSEVATAKEFLEILRRDGDEPGPEPAAAPGDPVSGASAPGPVAHEPSAAEIASSELASSDRAEPPGSYFEQAWASIVAGYAETADITIRTWPEEEDVATADRGGKGRTTKDGSVTERSGDESVPSGRIGDDRRKPAQPPAVEPSLLDALDTFGAHLDDEDDDYHPPAPPPFPRFARITIVAVIAIAAGLAIIADPDLLPIVPSAASLIGCVAILAGAVALIGRLRSGKDDEDDDDPSNGAVL